MKRMLASAAVITAVAFGAPALAQDTAPGAMEDRPPVTTNDETAASPDMDSGLDGDAATRTSPESTAAVPGNTDADAGTMDTAALHGLVGATVYSQDDEEAGEIAEVIPGTDGQTAQVVIERGGFLGMGKSRHVVSASDLQMDADRVRLPMTDDQIAELPEYEAEEPAAADEPVGQPAGQPMTTD
ncbi:PRC-barrel domain-containing protein [Caenispirillum bisanense]|uniref:PRC-barrel domain-containing protein n=1 Tax=Caenispirillum bisanense TaxID=414052 RepID=UPI0031D21B30